jgi:hypothetical protein
MAVLIVNFEDDGMVKSQTKNAIIQFSTCLGASN